MTASALQQDPNTISSVLLNPLCVFQSWLRSCVYLTSGDSVTSDQPGGRHEVHTPTDKNLMVSGTVDVKATMC